MIWRPAECWWGAEADMLTLRLNAQNYRQLPVCSLSACAEGGSSARAHIYSKAFNLIESVVNANVNTRVVEVSLFAAAFTLAGER